MSLVGSICGLALMYVFPIGVHIKSQQLEECENPFESNHHKKHYLSLFFHALLIMFGGYVMLVNLI